MIMAFPLMSLPVELRARIINYALLQSRAKPPYPDSLEKRVLVDDYRPCNNQWTKGVHYENDPSGPVVNSSALLLVSRQINAETRKQLSLDPAHSSYDLDVMLNNDRQLLPTWTRVPQICNRVENLNMTFRLFGRRPKPRKYQKKDVWRMLEWRAAPLCNFILGIVTRFIALGASSPKSKAWRNVNRQTTISCLNIDVERTQDTCTSCPMWADCPHLWELEKQVTFDWNLTGKTEPLCVLHPELFLYWLITHIKSLLRMPYYAEHSFGQLLYSHVGSITFSLEGTVVETLDLGHALGSLPKRSSFWIHVRDPDNNGTSERWLPNRFQKKMLAKREINGLGRPEQRYDTEFWNHCEFDLFDFRQ